MGQPTRRQMLYCNHDIMEKKTKAEMSKSSLNRTLARLLLPEIIPCI